MKKALLTMTAIATLAAPISSLVSCNILRGRYDTENTGEVKIWTSFSKDGKQYNALKKIIEQYNEDTKKQSSKYYGSQELKIISISEGYKKMSPTLRTKFKVRDKKTLPNLVIGYPDDVGTISYFDMMLDLGFNEEKQEIKENSFLLKDDFGVKKDVFNEDFVKQNTQIAGVNSNGFWAIPLAKSTDMITINKPVFKYLVEQMRESGATIGNETNAPMINEILNEPQKDLAKIKKSFILKEKNSQILNNFTISDDIFINLESMITFVKNAAKVFDFSNKENESYALGIDCVTNLMYTMGYSMAEANMDDFFFSKNKDQYIEYNYGDKNKKSQQNFEKIYKLIEESINTGGLFLKQQKKYSSNISKVHKMAISIGSTAGYNYNFVKSSYKIKKDETTTYKESFKTSDFVKILTDLNEDNNYLSTTIGKNGKEYEIFSNEYSGETGQQNNKYKSTLSKSDLKKELEKLSTNDYFGKDVLFLVESGTEFEKIYNEIDDSNKKEILTIGTKKLVIIKNNLINNEDNSNSLQEDEMMLTRPIRKFSSKNKKNITLVQGPSLYGVHSNKIQDSETRKFISWLFEERTENGISKKPSESFAEEANYIVPTKDFLNKKVEVIKGKSNQEAFKLFKNIQKDENEIAFDNPVDHTTGRARSYLELGLSTSFSQWFNNSNNIKSRASTIEELYDNLKRYDKKIFG